MPFNGSGTFSPAVAGYPAVPDTVIDANAYNAVIADLAAGLTNAMTRDSQGIPASPLSMGGLRIINLGFASGPFDAVPKSQADSLYAPIASPNFSGVATFSDLTANDAVAASVRSSSFLSTPSMEFLINGTQRLSFDASTGNVRFTSPYFSVVDASSPKFEVIRTSQRSLLTLINSSNQILFSEGNGSGGAGLGLMAFSQGGGAQFGNRAVQSIGPGQVSIGSSSNVSVLELINDTAAWKMLQLAGDAKMYFGYATGGGGNNNFLGLDYGGNKVYPTTDNTVALGSGSFRWTAVYAVNGTIQTSDLNAKTRINALSLGKEFIQALKPVSYQWKSAEQNKEPLRFGFIAQDVEKLLGFSTGLLHNRPGERLGLTYTELIAPLVKATQEAFDLIDELKAKIKDLEARLSVLE